MKEELMKLSKRELEKLLKESIRSEHEIHYFDNCRDNKSSSLLIETFDNITKNLLTRRIFHSKVD